MKLTNKEKYIALTANMPITKSDAIVILEGDGFDRIKHACKLYNDNYSDSLVFSGGITNFNYGSYPFKFIKNKFNECGVDSNKVIVESNSTNTKEQAIEIIKMCLKHNWKSIILTASHYHQYRAYLTFIQELYSNKLENTIKIYSSPSILPWFKPTDWGVKYDLLDQEFNRIQKYKLKGDICSYKKALQYIKWVEQN